MNAYTGTTREAETLRRRSLRIIFFVMLMDVMGVSILLPVAPYIVQRYSSDALMVTLLSVIYAGALFFAAPALGKISDRVGRKPVLLVSVLGSAFGYFVFGAAGALWVLFLSRLIDGITGGNMSTAMAWIADTSTAEERPKNFVIVGMAFGLGFVLGPALGGPLGQLNLDAPAYAAGVLSLISLLLIFVALPESLPRERRERSPLRLDDFNPLASIRSMMHKPGLAPLLISYALFNLAFDGANSVTGVFVSRKFLAEPWHLGLLFVVSGLALGVVQGMFTQRLVARLGEKSTALFGLLGNAAGGLMMLAAPALWLLYPISFLSGSVTGFIWAPMATLATNRVSEREQGQLAGVNAAISGLMSALGPLWAGFSYDHVAAGSPYLMSAILIVLAALVLGRTRLAARAGQPVNVQSPAD